MLLTNSSPVKMTSFMPKWLFPSSWILRRSQNKSGIIFSICCSPVFNSLFILIVSLGAHTLSLKRGNANKLQMFIWHFLSWHQQLTGHRVFVPFGQIHRCHHLPLPAATLHTPPLCPISTLRLQVIIVTHNSQQSRALCFFMGSNKITFTNTTATWLINHSSIKPSRTSNCTEL